LTDHENWPQIKRRHLEEKAGLVERLFAEGKNRSQAARALGLHVSNLTDWCVRNGVAMPNVPRGKPRKNG